jgi:hypothetical protein
VLSTCNAPINVSANRRLNDNVATTCVKPKPARYVPIIALSFQLHLILILIFLSSFFFETAPASEIAPAHETEPTPETAPAHEIAPAPETAPAHETAPTPETE